MSEEVKILPLPKPDEPKLGTPIFYTKSNYFRVIHADGLYGGGTGIKDVIAINLFSQRTPHVESTEQDLAGNENTAKRVVKIGIERELEATISINITLAKGMVKWLEAQIKAVEAADQKLEVK